MIGAEPKRLFVSVEDQAFLDGLKLAPGQFVATRLALRLGAKIMLSMQVRDDERRLEVPAVVVGRRTPSAPQSALRAGVILRIADPMHPNVMLVESILNGSVVDFSEQLRLIRPAPATAAFSSVDELLSELNLLAAGESAQLPLDRPVKRGERLLVTVTLDAPHVRGQPRPPMPAAATTLTVDVKTVVRHDNEAACLGVLSKIDDANALEEFIQTITGKTEANADTLRA